MPKTKNQKLKILYVAKYLLENSDENHPVVTDKIVDYLGKCGISAEKRSVYKDINVLATDIDNGGDLGIEIIRGHRNMYRLLSRPFDFDDLRLLAQCVYSMKFIPETQAKKLINVLGKFCSKRQRT